MNNKTETLEIDLSDYPKDLLIRFILFAHENNLTCFHTCVDAAARVGEYALSVPHSIENRA